MPKKISEFKKIIESFKDYKITILGDLMLDEYVYGSVERLFQL